MIPREATISNGTPMHAPTNEDGTGDDHLPSTCSFHGCSNDSTGHGIFLQNDSSRAPFSAGIDTDSGKVAPVEPPSSTLKSFFDRPPFEVLTIGGPSPALSSSSIVASPLQDDANALLPASVADTDSTDRRGSTHHETPGIDDPIDLREGSSPKVGDHSAAIGSDPPESDPTHSHVDPSSAFGVRGAGDCVDSDGSDCRPLHLGKRFKFDTQDELMLSDSAPSSPARSMHASPAHGFSSQSEDTNFETRLKIGFQREPQERTQTHILRRVSNRTIAQHATALVMLRSYWTMLLGIASMVPAPRTSLYRTSPSLKVVALCLPRHHPTSPLFVPMACWARPLPSEACDLLVLLCPQSRSLTAFHGTLTRVLSWKLRTFPPWSPMLTIFSTE